ncbi:hypothetical protein JL720_15172 [Aureococcus anophagefferens]|nr:hypothetical protein JL720_15172 [Aureococcus anophagefferens]
MDFFAAAKDAMNAASEQASQRVAQAQAGKRLLDDGGPEMEQKIATKAHCRRTTNADTMAAAQVLSAMPPPAPFISGEEDDAIKILWARGKARTAQERAQAVSQQAMGPAQRCKRWLSRVSAATDAPPRPGVGLAAP